MTNRLARETSPYLLQHQDNPVDWFPWGEEAFAEARRLDRPVLLSVGYSACHWCHVMAHESFEKPETAALMNRLFVNIKVDCEERPDIDAVYMQAVQALTGRGGWPMTVFLMPDGAPFYGGTYFPPQDQGGLPAFPRLLEAIAAAYADRRTELQQSGQQMVDHITELGRLPESDMLLSTDLLDAAAEAMLEEHDETFGGFGSAPKFPQPMTIDFLLRYYQRTQKQGALEASMRTLGLMAFGGMYDQVGGGFHRYSTDAVWLVPHFEKMLYDNAQLARVYLDAFQLTGDDFYRQIAVETLDYVLRELTDPQGGFYSSQDADSEGEEGRFFLWTPAQLQDLLGEDAPLIAKYYGVSESGNFESGHAYDGPPRSILHLRQGSERFAEANDLDTAAFKSQVAAAKARLFTAREGRVHPGRDDKVLTGWNGLMLEALARAARVLGDQRYRDAAVRNADFLLAAMRSNTGRLLHSWKDGVAKVDAFLDDYALLGLGLLAVYEATFEERYLREALRLADEALDLFWDESQAGFYDTGRDQAALIARPRSLFDSPLPSGTSAAINLLLRLAALSGNETYAQRAETALQGLAPYFERGAGSFGNLLCALDFYLTTPHELAIVYPSDPAEAEPLLDVLREAYLPRLLLVGGPDGVDSELTPLLRDRHAIDGKATAYLCERFTCQLPTTDPAELRKQLGIV